MASVDSTSATFNSAGTVAQATALARVRVSARWFYWIAGLSLINSAVVIFGGNFHFVVGLGVTSVVDALAKQAGNAGVVLDLIINGCVAGLFILFGSFASKAQKWAFLVGMALYALDGFLLLTARDILSVAFHAYALYCLYRGLAAADATGQA
ncbi:MAG: hypothetical protein ABSF59_13190 [Candidatus Sulfotelmatobacter sp.]|jgi:hypothetical protein